MAAANAGAGSPFLRAGYVWAPNVDGWVIPDDPLAMYASGRQHDVPLIVGMNGNEGSLMTRAMPVGSVDDFEQHVTAVYPALADDLLAHYGADARFVLTERDPDSWFESFAAYLDRLCKLRHGQQPRTVAALHKPVHSRVYLHQALAVETSILVCDR